MRKSIPLLLLCALLLCGCGRSPAGSEPYSLTIWYADSPLSPGLTQLAEEYNRTRGRDALPVTLRAWESEEQLLRALQNSAPPALVLCSHAFAFSLAEAGSLRETEGIAPVYPDWLRERADCVGRGWFPIGFDLPLLCAPESFPCAPAELLRDAASLARTSGCPALAVERFAPLFYQFMLDAGTEFHADSARDVFSEDYVNLYNLIAGAAFDGGLTFDGAAAPSCHIAASSALPGSDLRGLRFSPLSEGPLLAEGCGLAVTVRETRAQRALPAFLRWLAEPGRMGGLALGAGLIPAAAESLSPENALEAELVSLTGRVLHLPDAGADYYVNQSAFEEQLRAALELLR